MGVWSAVGALALALALGPLLGGILTEYANWHRTFFINVSVGIATLALAQMVIAEGDAPLRRRSMSAGSPPPRSLCSRSPTPS